jgi:hypothetical protein
MPNGNQPSYSAAHKMRGMVVSGSQNTSDVPFAEHVPKDYKSPDVEDRRHEDKSGMKASGTVNFK